MKYNIDDLVNKDIDNIENEVEIINNDKPIFKKSDYEIEEGKPVYFEPDEYERSNGAIAIIGKNTMPFIINKNLKYPNPYGWSKNLEKTGIFERCHIIAYSLSAKIADKRNIFIGTEHLNTSTMMKIENRVKQYINDNNVKILYKVTIKYKEKNQIPIGILIEAKSLEDNFSICRFCYNIQLNAVFDYFNGIILENNKIKEIKKYVTKTLKRENSNNVINREKNIDYVINRKTNTFHIKSANCNKLNNVEPKYLIETTTTNSELIKIDLKPCKNCIKN